MQIIKKYFDVATQVEADEEPITPPLIDLPKVIKYSCEDYPWLICECTLDPSGDSAAIFFHFIERTKGNQTLRGKVLEGARAYADLNGLCYEVQTAIQGHQPVIVGCALHLGGLKEKSVQVELLAKKLYQSLLTDFV